MNLPSLDDFIVTVVLDPKQLTEKFTVSDVERFSNQDSNAVQWAASQLKAALNTQGATHAA